MNHQLGEAEMEAYMHVVNFLDVLNLTGSKALGAPSFSSCLWHHNQERL